MAKPQIAFTRTKKYCDHVADKLDQIINDQDFTDFKLTVKGEALYCHKLTLAIHSPVLCAMLKSEMSEVSKQTFSLDHIPLDIVRKILKFMYVGEISLDTEQLMDLLKASDYLQMEVLREMCVSEVPAILKPDNIIPWLEVTTKLDLSDITSTCTKIMVSNFMEVSSQPEFLALESTEVQQYFTEVMKICDIDHDSVLYLTMSWANHDPQNRLADLENLLRILQLTSCSYDTILKPGNVISWLKVAAKQDLSDITSMCTKIMVSNFAEMTSQPGFLALQLPEVHQYFTEVISAHGIDPDSVFHAALMWTNHDTKNRLSDLENLLYTVQPNNCSHHAIVDVMDKYGTMIVSNMNVFKLLTKALKQTQKLNLMPVPTIVGGQVGDKIRSVAWKLDQSKNFIELCKLPSVLTRRHSACKCPQGFAITGGKNSDICMMFNASTQLWSTLQKMLTKRYKHGSLCLKNVLHVFGGCVKGATNMSVDFLALDDGTWQHGVDLPIAVVWPKVADIKDTVFLLDAEKSKELLKLDLERKVWDKLASLPVDNSCLGVSMAVANYKLCVAGGENMICAWYDPATNAWSIGQKLTKQHKYGSLLVYNNTILILGGNYCSGCTDEIEELNLPDGSWSVSNIKMPASLRLHHAMVLDIPQQD